MTVVIVHVIQRDGHKQRCSLRRTVDSDQLIGYKRQGVAKSLCRAGNHLVWLSFYVFVLVFHPFFLDLLAFHVQQEWINSPKFFLSVVILTILNKPGKDKKN